MNQSQGSWRRGLFVVVLCAAGVAAGSAWSRPSEAPASRPPGAMAQSSVAVVNLMKLFEGLTEYKEAIALIETKAKEHKPALDALTQQLKAAQEELNMLKEPSAAQRIERRGKVIELVAQLRAKETTIDGLTKVQAGDVLRRIYLKATEACKKLAKQDGWDVIIVDDTSNEPPETVDSEDGKGSRPILFNEVQRFIQQRQVLSATERVDVTTALITLMNNEFKGGKK